MTARSEQVAAMQAVDVANIEKAAATELAGLLAKNQIQRPSVAIEGGTFAPRTMDEMSRVARMYYTSGMLPSSWMKAGNADACIATAMIAFALAFRLKRDATWATQFVMFVNNRPCLWGDGPLDLVLSHPHLADFKEGWKNLGPDGECTDNTTAWCEIMRKGFTPYRYEFSVRDAKTAGLWKKSGPWTNTPKRMLQLRARGFCIRGIMADALGGASIAEEQIDAAQAENAARLSEVSTIIQNLGTEPTKAPEPEAKTDAPATPTKPDEPPESAEDDGAMFLASLRK